MKCKDIKVGEMYEYRFVVTVGTDEQLNACRANNNKLVNVIRCADERGEYDGLFIVKNDTGEEFFVFGAELFDVITNY